LVNAAGPWISDVMAHRLATPARAALRLVKGSHIVVPQLFTHDRAYIFQNADGRIVFAIPYQGAFTLIGTTDLDFTGDLDHVGISDDEISYLCGAVSEYFVREVEPSDVAWSYAGVRPLQHEGEVSAQEATRDFVLDLDGREGEPLLLNVIGGKITTFRHLAEEALNKLAIAFPGMDSPWTRGSTLPGGDFAHDQRDRVVADLQTKFAFLDAASAERLVATYGTLAEQVLSGATTLGDLGAQFGHGLSEREVTYLVRNEWALAADDVLWRRTKLGLHMSAAERSRLAEWFGAREAASSAA
jgi:glycerol-3-phosphate dehydrogenase